MSPQFKNIICDVDGTLIDSALDVLNAQLWMIHHYGFTHLTMDDIIPHFGKPIHEMMENIFPQEEHHRIPESVEKYRNRYKERWFETTTPFPHVASTVEKLHSRGVRFATATTKTSDTTKIILEHFGIAKYFSSIQGTDKGMPYKPNPFIIEKILSAQHWKQEETIIIGDSEMDIQVGKNAGIAMCGVTYGSLSREQMVQWSPDFVIDSFAELIKIIFAAENAAVTTSLL